MNKIKILLICLCVIFFSKAGFSHTLWLMADDYNPAVGQNVIIEVCWGHGFDKKEPLKENSFKQIYIISPDGSIIKPEKIDSTHYNFKPVKPGFYAVGAETNPGFMSKTTTGRKMQNKKGLDSVVSCMSFDIRAKIVIKAGKEKADSQISVKHPVEIIPLDDITALGKDDVLTVSVLFNGKPVENCKINADYEGFKGKDHESAFSVNTDNQGKAQIKLIKKGSWILQVRHEIPFEDMEICDKYMYGASFGFSIK